MIDSLPGDTFKTGQVLNNTYEILGILGRGGTGEVYKARNTINNRVSAIKVLNAEFSANDDYLELIKREEEMRAIMHDAVVRYSDNSRTDDGHIFLVMDYIDGPSMDAHLKRGGMDARDLLIIAHRVAEGLVATHARGIVHRDLSPDNIILRGGEPARATIIDFGIAKDTTDGARTIVGNDFAGKYEYAAPEQIDGHAEGRSDLYALGASLLATFRGQVPRVGSSPGQVVRIKQQPLDVSGVPEPLAKVIAWLTAPEISNRPRDAAELVHFLDDIVMPDKGKAEPEDKAGKKRRIWPWLVVPALAAGGAGLWVSGVLQPLLDGFLHEPLPVAAPFKLNAVLDENGDSALLANAPDEAQAQIISAAFANVTGASVPDGAITLAQGSPSETWGQDMAALFGVASDLEDWQLVVADRNVGLTGLATDQVEKAFIATRFDEVASQAGYQASTDIAAGPRLLAAQALTDAAAPLSDCGVLTLTAPEGDTFLLGDTVRFSGDIASTQSRDAIAERLERIIGDRELRLDLNVLNDVICEASVAFTDFLGASPEAVGNSNINIALGYYGGSDEPNLTGVYKSGDNLKIEVIMPADDTRGYLWVLDADVNGNIYNLLPTQYRRDNTVANLGVVENGLRRITITYPKEVMLAEGRSKLSFELEPPAGKSQIYAIYSSKPLFSVLRPIEESITAFTEDLLNRKNDSSLEIYAISSRIFELRE